VVDFQLLDSISRDSKELQCEVLQVDYAFSTIWNYACGDTAGHHLHHRGHSIFNNPWIERHRWVRIKLSASQIPANGIDRINPYWKLALVFKCLTDNILLDDFKSVLQRLGDLKVDGTTAMLPNSMVLKPSEKSGSADYHHEEAFAESSSRVRRERPSGDISEAMDHDSDLGNGPGRDNTTANAVGKLGIKINKLPKLPS
jgi:hypothetical protein